MHAVLQVMSLTERLKLICFLVRITTFYVAFYKYAHYYCYIGLYYSCRIAYTQFTDTVSWSVGVSDGYVCKPCKNG